MIAKIKSFLQSSLSKLWSNSSLHVPLVVLATFVFGVAVGKFGTPDSVHTKTTQSTQENSSSGFTDDKSTSVDDRVTNDTKRQIHTIETHKPDGTIVKETYDLNESTVFVDNRTNKTDDLTKTSSSSKSSTKTTDKTVTNYKWDVSAMVGVDTKAILNGDVRNATVYGAAVQYNLFGPVDVGAFGLTSGNVGLMGSLKF